MEQTVIPKVIHFCWMSEDPFPEKIQFCIESWKKFLPDYEIKRWSYQNFPRGKSKWVDQAFDAKRYAFAADYIRFYALYTEGGIYLDSDVEVLKSFNDMLGLDYFVCEEYIKDRIEAAVMGFRKGNRFCKMMLDYYSNRSFVSNEGRLDTKVLPSIFNELLLENSIQIRRVERIEEVEHLMNSDKTFALLTNDYFSPKDTKTDEIKLTSNTHSIHHFANSWWKDHQRKYSLWERLINRLRIILKIQQSQ
ncbi:MAG: glycosyl transferase [Muribaculum sp.]|nr:glycosyl transferase [Muribaculum sp.]